MTPEELLAQITPKYGLDDVQSDAVEAVSVLDFEELEDLIGSAVKARTQSLMAELSAARKELNDFAAGGGDGLEAEAAEAALEAEARALDAKADAEQRAAAAESKVAQLSAQLRDLESSSGGVDPIELEAVQGELADTQGDLQAAEEGQRAAEEARDALQAQLDEAHAQLDEAQAKLEEAQAQLAGGQDGLAGLQARVSELEAELTQVRAALAEAEASGGAGGAAADDEPAAPVTESDLKHARRLAEAFLEEVFMDDESKSNAAIAAGNVAEAFKRELAAAYKQYVKRVSAAVRAQQPIWDDCLEACSKREW